MDDPPPPVRTSVTQITWGEQATEHDDTTTSEEEESSCQLYDMATLILEECKDAASLPNLDTAIYFFRETLSRRPTPHPLRSDSLKDLAGALVTRFSLTSQRQDLDQAFSLCNEICDESNNILKRTVEQSQLEVRV